MKKIISFDHIVGILSFILLALIVVVIWHGDQTHPYVNSTLKEGSFLSADHRQLHFTFSREMDRASVEEHFTLTPPVSGQFSWVGRRMAYSFLESLEYDQTYHLHLAQAEDLNGRPLEEPFSLTLKVPPQYLFYLNEKEQFSRYDFREKQAEVLSPPSLQIIDYRVHPNRDTFYWRVKEGERPDGSEILSLYEWEETSQKLTLLLDGQAFKPFEFKLSPNGQWLAVSLGAVYPMGEFWVTDAAKVRLMKTGNRKWSDFWWNSLHGTPLYFSNDSRFLLGMDYSDDSLILPLEKEDFTPVQVGYYSGVHGFNPKGNMILLSQEEVAFSEMTLMVRKNDGSTQTLAGGLGQLFYPTFHPQDRWIYFVVMKFDFQTLDLVESFDREAYADFFTLYRYDLSTLTLEPLLVEEAYAQGEFDFSADGKGMVIERYLNQELEADAFALFDVFARQTPELWWMDIESAEMTPLGIFGKKPHLD